MIFIFILPTSIKELWNLTGTLRMINIHENELILIFVSKQMYWLWMGLKE